MIPGHILDPDYEVHRLRTTLTVLFPVHFNHHHREHGLGDQRSRACAGNGASALHETREGASCTRRATGECKLTVTILRLVHAHETIQGQYSSEGLLVDSSALQSENERLRDKLAEMRNQLSVTPKWDNKPIMALVSGTQSSMVQGSIPRTERESRTGLRHDGGHRAVDE